MLPTTFSARRSGLFLIEFMFECAKFNLCLLSPQVDFRILLQSTVSSMLIGGFSDIHSSNPAKFHVSYQCNILLISLK